MSPAPAPDDLDAPCPRCGGPSLARAYTAHGIAREVYQHTDLGCPRLAALDAREAALPRGTHRLPD